MKLGAGWPSPCCQSGELFWNVSPVAQPVHPDFLLRSEVYCVKPRQFLEDLLKVTV